jgi:hydrogenase expression/formation protein HypC
MCLALPARIVELQSADQAFVELGGVRKSVSIALIPEARLGDYVIVHVGHAIGVLDAEEAEKTLALFAELAAAERSA